MSKRYSGKSFKDSSVMKKAKLTLKEKEKLREKKKIINSNYNFFYFFLFSLCYFLFPLILSSDPQKPVFLS